MDVIDLVPNSLSFRVITTLDLHEGDEIPAGFTGRVKLHHDDHVAVVAWYSDGVLHNPGRRHPAYRRFRANGKVKFEMFYEFGLLHDPARGHPAVRGWFANGRVHYEERYRSGRRHDGADGAAAIRKYRDDGSVRHELRYRDGRRTSSGPTARS